ncbi:hypothetical protein [Hymenobacter algoricola]|uniref:Uncharacterized protein n=1 Tax=Hymenobacter algoricola TaxID=486267 RepID=A0ABP7MNC1_9BACT
MFVARLAVLLFSLALLLPAAPAAAADGSPLVRAAGKGRVLTHRPNYKRYNANRPRWFFQRW